MLVHCCRVVALRTADGLQMVSCRSAVSGCSRDRAHTSAQEVCGGVLEGYFLLAARSRGNRAVTKPLARTGCAPLQVLH